LKIEAEPNSLKTLEANLQNFSEEELSQLLATLSTEELRKLAIANSTLLKSSQELGPQTDDELWDWIKKNLGLEIPRIAVCEDHDAPFQVLADIYFERLDGALIMANRSGAKTMLSALIHLLNILFKPGVVSFSVGAQEDQSRRVYMHLQNLLKRHGKVDSADNHPLVVRMIQRLTDFKNGSKMEILVGTPTAVNGPHGAKVHTDEAELMDVVTYAESRNISQSQDIEDPTAPGGVRHIPSQDWVTSTRKSGGGMMQGLINEIAEAKRNGFEPPYELRSWCVFESSARVDNCQVAYPDLPNAEKCNCDKVVKGKWEDDTHRRFSDVCKGRLARSGGYLTLRDIQKTFKKNDVNTWEAQQECSKPDIGGMVLRSWSRQRQGIKYWVPDPELGDFYMGVDFGSTDPNAVTWWQLLNQDVMWYGYHDDKRDAPKTLLPSGSLVAFSEIYKAEIANTTLAVMIKDKEEKWQEEFPDFKVKFRFADPAAKGGRIELAKMGLRTAFYCTREVEEHIKTCNSLLDDNKLFVDVLGCPMWCDEADSWHYKKKKPGEIDDPTKPVEDFDHQMAVFRYTAENLKWITRRGATTTKPGAGRKVYRSRGRQTNAGASKYQPLQGI
jgi:hypothetical protein